MNPVALLLLVALFAPVARVTFPIAIASADGGPIARELPYVPISDDVAVHPGPDAWLSIARPAVSIRLLNTTFTPNLDASWLKFDGQRSSFAWNPLNRTIFVPLRDPLADGTHAVDAYLEDSQGTGITAGWSFHQDTLPPVVYLDPLPATADRRVYDINGTLVEPNLVGIEVNGFQAIFDGDRFLVQVLLWPGRNDLFATAVDRAGNRGHGQAEIRWSPPPPADVAYAAFVHPNTSFIARFPTTWEVHADYELESGYVSDVAALEPAAAFSTRSTIVVVSRLAGQGMNEGWLLGILENAVAITNAQSGVTIVSRPRLLEGSGGPVVGQFSLVASLPSGERVFQQVSAFWSRAVGRIWIMIGSVATDEVDAQWYALQTAYETFQAVEPEDLSTGSETPSQAVERALLVTMVAILIVLTVFVAALYSVRKSGRGSPPMG